MNFCILGAGAWGTAMALHLSRLNHRVTLTPRRFEHALQIASARENVDYLPGFQLDYNIQIGCEVGPVIMEADVVILACPSKALRALCRLIAQHLDASWNIKMVVTLCKGVEPQTFLTPSEVVRSELPDVEVAALSGPTFAGEVAEGKPTAITLAAIGDDAFLSALQQSLNSEQLRVYRSDDLMGIELGGCLKNVYAIGAGVCDGLQLGDNAKASYLTRALAEMARVGVAIGGKLDSFYGLSGFGDLVATCNGEWSRNRFFGENLARGLVVSELLENRKTVVEGYYSVKNFHDLCRERELEAPILEQLYAILYEERSPLDAILALMSRQPTFESSRG